MYEGEIYIFLSGQYIFGAKIFSCNGEVFSHSFTRLDNEDKFWLTFTCEGP